MEKHREKYKTVHMAFLDLEKSFDRVPHNLIWRALRFHGVPEEYVKWVELLYHNTSSMVRCPAATSPPFNITVGVHQGSALLPLLFILCMDTMTADLQRPHPWTLLYADDVTLVDIMRIDLEEQAQQWYSWLSDSGLKINIAKTEYLECGPQTNGTIRIDGQDSHNNGEDEGSPPEMVRPHHAQ
uniref:ribonuclease H n=1 Tax=Sinocyclocheilus anshuiensis TaxID=1608454 RepID=A0A671L7T5_9TELE